jgi:hypothetical protein
MTTAPKNGSSEADCRGAMIPRQGVGALLLFLGSAFVFRSSHLSARSRGPTPCYRTPFGAPSWSPGRHPYSGAEKLQNRRSSGWGSERFTYRVGKNVAIGQVARFARFHASRYAAKDGAPVSASVNSSQLVNRLVLPVSPYDGERRWKSRSF